MLSFCVFNMICVVNFLSWLYFMNIRYLKDVLYGRLNHLVYVMPESINKHGQNWKKMLTIWSSTHISGG
ncbi:hypothetical protein Hanom_Chr02g00102301 [Helianthus anomalus]